MNTKYFILAKEEEDPINNNERNQIYYINSPLTFILPSSLLKYYGQSGLFENELIEWSKQFCDPNKNFLDIGAHTGTYSISLASLCNRVYSFEPQKMTYYALCGSVALSHKKNIDCFNMALGSPEQVGKMTLNIHSPDGGGSSLHKSNVNPVLAEEIVNVVALDIFRLDNIGLIKIDVEDNELGVLKGAVQTIKNSNFPKILFESNNENQELFDFLKEEFGYQIFNINGFSNMFLADR